MLESKSRTRARQTKGILILRGNFLCLSCPCSTFALQHGGFVPREWLAAKGLSLGLFSVGNTLVRKGLQLEKIGANFGPWNTGPHIFMLSNSCKF